MTKKVSITEPHHSKSSLLNHEERKKMNKVKSLERANIYLKELSSQKEEDIFREAFDLLSFTDTGNPEDNYIDKIRYLVSSNGLEEKDPRIVHAMDHLREVEKSNKDLTLDLFKDAFQTCFSMMRRLLNNQFTYRD
mmetsp:Transcript_31478/g.27844  ORF Transcript_31478/g.27844 Transcript_31478/m.27844 type:complete len:136 (+) Transcript_31478:65-472(+)